MRSAFFVALVGAAAACTSSPSESSAQIARTEDAATRTSTIAASDQAANADGQQCILVSDVIIVNGEETRADKRMCRQPPAARYAIAQA